MLPSRKLFYCRLNLFKHLKFVAAYSRKSDSKNQGPYKIVKSNDVIDGKYCQNFSICIIFHYHKLSLLIFINLTAWLNYLFIEIM